MRLEGLPKNLRGQTLRSSEAANFTLIETIYPPGFKMPRHTHELTHLSLVLQGSYTERFGSKNRSGKPSMLVFHPQNEEHSVNFHNAGARLFSVVIKPRWIERIREHTTLLDNPADFNSGSSVWIAGRLYNEFRAMDEVSPLVIEGLSLEMLAEASRQRKRDKQPLWLKPATEIIEARFSESLNLEEIAEAVGVHPTHLSRVFRRRLGCTVGEYVRRLRVEYASRQLSKSDITFAEIAAAAGFSDQSHFARTFKRFTGLSPSEYRRISRSR